MAARDLTWCGDEESFFLKIFAAGRNLEDNDPNFIVLGDCFTTRARSKDLGKRG